MGFDGGTALASLSPADYVTVLTPNGSEIWPQQQNFDIRWRSRRQNAAATTFTIDLMRQGNATPITTITTSATESGVFNWTVPGSIPSADDYLIRVRRNDGSGLLDVSDQPFSIRTPISVYYVNDDTVQTGDITTAAVTMSTAALTLPTPRLRSVQSWQRM